MTSSTTYKLVLLSENGNTALAQTKTIEEAIALAPPYPTDWFIEEYRNGHLTEVYA